MVECKRKKGETFEAFVRRFNKRLIQSGKVLQFKKVKFHLKPLNKNLQKSFTLKRQELRARKEYLIKVGRLKEDDFRGKRKRR